MITDQVTRAVYLEYQTDFFHCILIVNPICGLHNLIPVLPVIIPETDMSYICNVMRRCLNRIIGTVFICRRFKIKLIAYICLKVIKSIRSVYFSATRISTGIEIRSICSAVSRGILDILIQFIRRCFRIRHKPQIRTMGLNIL